MAGGQKQRLTPEGDVSAGLESGDGRTLLYNRRGALLAVPLAGGPSRQIAPCVSGWAVASAAGGIYYTTCSAETGSGGTIWPLHFVGAATGQDRVLGTLEKFATNSAFGLTVSSDGRVIVYDRLLRAGHDLMLIENFK